ncbi:M23 family metallopeptidase [Thiomicrorhabdus cannonii]|uniref:M23 family metallopeptidase n=1 Tax=Thiomicrorhabdus cannonii TaxID=2748011 RepID=UPI0015BBCC39|nr:M23 family metallopeptidase [Thiomicrorhabdus cannonii]
MPFYKRPLLNSRFPLLKNHLHFGCLLILGASVLSGCSGSASRSSDRLILDNGDDTGHQYVTRSGQNRSSCRNPYRVAPGDTLSEIAVKCNVNMDQLAYANHLQPPYFLRAGQKLTLPGSAQAARQPLEKQPETKATASWHWPMANTLPYAYVRDNSGLNALEIYGPPGQEVKAVEEGEVVYAGNGITHYGWLVMIKHPSGYISIYAHNSRVLVREGQQVKNGTPIALLGASGITPKPKLYLEARYRGRKVDVKTLLKPQ